MSLQLFAQPFISSNAFSDYKQYTQPRDWATQVYGRDVGTVVRNDKTVTIDPDGAGPALPMSFARQDFNVKSLRGNAVLRWEYMPGSTLYFVWTQNRSDYEANGDFNFGQSMHRMMNAPAENIFMIKATYWWNP